MKLPLILLDIDSIELMKIILGAVFTVSGALLFSFYKDSKTNDVKLNETILSVKADLANQISINKEKIEKEINLVKAEIAIHKFEIQDRLNSQNITLLNKMEDIKNSVNALRK